MEIIDHGAIRRLLSVIGGDVEDLQELREEFEATTPTLVGKMRQAVEEENLDSLRISAHSLKSNGRDSGALKLAVPCEALEKDCKTGELSAPADRVEEIGRTLDITREALRGMTLDDE